MENLPGVRITARLVGISMMVLGVALAGVAILLRANPRLGFPLPLYILIFLFIFNGFNHFRKKLITNKMSHLISLLVNLAAVTLLVHFTGGLKSEFYLAYFLVPAVAALYFGPREIFASFFLVTFSYGWFWVRQYQAITPSMMTNFFLRITFLILVSIPFALFIEYERKYQQELTASYENLKQANEELKETQVRLVQSAKMTALGELAASIAHELDQPLASIRLYAHLGLSNLDEAHSLCKYLAIINAQVARLEKIVKNIKTFSRQPKDEFKPVNTYHPLSNVLQLLSEELKLSKIKINKKLSPNLPEIAGDGNQLQQVFLNILTNARDAIRASGGGGGSITVATRASKFRKGVADVIAGRGFQGRNKKSRVEFVEISFKDSGCGIPKEILGKIFDPFFTTKSSGNSLGLGLSITQKIVQNHGGFIGLASEPGKGTMVKITFPAIEKKSNALPLPKLGGRG